MKSDSLFRNDRPVITKRGVHLDLKGLPPTPERLMELLNVFAAARYNVVLVEWEDMFPWKVDERFRGPTAYGPDDVHRFLRLAGELDIEIVPLVQCLGHMETPLSVPGYENLRELADDSSSLNPLADGARDLVQRMVDDVLELMPEVRHFHLGGDEARNMGTRPETKAYVEKHGKDKLYLRHVEPILDKLNDRGIRPILWHDMMIDWDSDALNVIARKSDLMVWGYSGNPDTTSRHFSTKHIQRFHDHGFTLWGGAAYKGADGHNVDLPDIDRRQENALAWSDVARRFFFKGVIATGWSRYSTNRLQCEPIDAALDSLINVGIILHDGAPPEAEMEACLAYLEELNEKERFEYCKQSLTRLAAARLRGWKEVQAQREQNALCRMDPRRSTSYARNICVRGLRSALQAAEKAATEVRESFAGLIEPIWLEEYLNARLIPLNDELSCLENDQEREK